MNFDPIPEGGVSLPKKPRFSEKHEFRILILDSDLKNLSELIRSTKHASCEIILHSSIDEIIRNGFPNLPSCLLLGQRPVDASDPLEILARLRVEKWNLPVIYLGQEWTLQSVVRTMRAGASDFLTVPIDKVELSNSLTFALARAAKQHQASMFASDARARVASLNKREGEIIGMVINGLLNKEIADRLDLALITVKVYRAQAMRETECGESC